jgi:hypothetical protein
MASVAAATMATMPSRMDFSMAVLLGDFPRKRPMRFLLVELGSGRSKGN